MYATTIQLKNGMKSVINFATKKEALQYIENYKKDARIIKIMRQSKSGEVCTYQRIEF
jgi:hypothetical protein